MTATYTNNPANRQIDRVRLEIDDRDTIPETDALLSDEEIQYFIDTHKHVLLAAAAAADQLGARFSGDPKSKKVGDLEIDYGEGGRSESFKAVAKSLRDRARRQAGANIYAGGLSQGEKATEKAKTDLVQPSFTVGIHDNPGTS